jgi:hypothetical protein
MATRDADDARWVDDRLAVLAPPAGWEPDPTGALDTARQRRPVRTRRLPWLTLAAAATVLAVFLLPSPVVQGFAHACGEFVRRSLAGGIATHAGADARPALSTDVRLSDVTGQPVTLAQHRGAVVLVAESPADCAQCAAEMAWFREFAERYRQRGLAVLIRATAPEAGAPQLKRTTLLVDRLGRVAVRHTGYCSKREFEADIVALLDEQAE